jgi:serine/threonine protein kinase
MSPELMARGRNAPSVKYSNKIDSAPSFLLPRVSSLTDVFPHSVLAGNRLLRDVESVQNRNGACEHFSSSFIVFQRCSLLSSQIHVLHDLRRPDIKFPPSWDKQKLARHTKIVQACLTHDPELRPSPKDLLSSDLLPPRVGDDSIEETIRLLCASFILLLPLLPQQTDLESPSSSLWYHLRPNSHFRSLQPVRRGSPSKRSLVRFLR